jgi:hypothetical protein
MDYFNSFKDSAANSWSSLTGKVSDYWSNRPSWLGGPSPQPQPPMSGRGKTYRRRHKKHKSKRRRTGRKSSHP